ncbi:MAG: hypothetical protein WBS20_02785 [Lysobacterales bacterium]
MMHLFDSTRLFLPLIVLAVTVGGCKAPAQLGHGPPDTTACIVIYDAGSSRTRLFVYQHTAAGWLQHAGPTAAALADPIRGSRGKTMADADEVIGEIVDALTRLRRDGPAGANGKPRWPAFDWQTHCNVEAAAVYGTAGMRLAEQYDAKASDVVWKKLSEKLGKKLGVPVTARTLSGYEEGLYAWLAQSQKQTDVNFGIAEMGGASVQVTFPCPSCEGARKVLVKGRSIDIYSHSFLGWGQDEAWMKFGQVPACTRGAGMDNPTWQIEDCEAGMTGFADAASVVSGLIKRTHGLRWHLTDAFHYMQKSDVDNFCRRGIDSGFSPETSCFRSVYLQYVLSSLALPLDGEPSDLNWTLGAVVCTATRCLENP